MYCFWDGIVCFLCSVQQECTNIFSSGGGQSLADLAGIPFLGCVPIDPRVGLSTKEGQSCVATLPHSAVSTVFQDIVKILTKPRVDAGGEDAAAS